MIGCFGSLGGLMQCLSMVAMPSLISFLLKIRLEDIYWVEIGLWWKVVYYACFGLTTQARQLFFILPILLFCGPIVPRTRSYLSKAVRNGQQTELFVAIAALEAVGAALGPSLTLGYAHSTPSHSSLLHAHTLYLIFLYCLLLLFFSYLPFSFPLFTSFHFTSPLLSCLLFSLLSSLFSTPLLLPTLFFSLLHSSLVFSSHSWSSLFSSIILNKHILPCTRWFLTTVSFPLLMLMLMLILMFKVHAHSVLLPWLHVWGHSFDMRSSSLHHILRQDSTPRRSSALSVHTRQPWLWD